MTENIEKIKTEIEIKLDEKFKGAGLLFWEDNGLEFIYTPAKFYYKVVEYLKNEFKFNLLTDLFGADYLNYPVPLPDNNRFEVIAQLYSTVANKKIFIKSYYPENEPETDSLTSLYPGANWFEREIFDMYGIKFKNHPNLKRILMYEGFAGHPLRKDYDIKKRQPIIGPEN
ncbi:MAG: NADH-quinone oxidoreductase subunit C [Candidatus Wallbacteria bacterium]